MFDEDTLYNASLILLAGTFVAGGIIGYLLRWAVA